MWLPPDREEVCRLFDEPPREDQRARHFEGTREGQPLSISFYRDDGGTMHASTAIHVERPTTEVLLRLVVERRWDQERVERGELVDVVIGDAAFDRRFLVEGAPAARVRALFGSSPELRRRLLEGLPSLEELSIDPGGVRLSLRRYPNAEELAAAVEVVLHVARALGNAPAGYRSAPDGQTASETQEMHALRDRFARRLAAEDRRGCIFVVALLLGLAVFLIFVLTR